MKEIWHNLDGPAKNKELWSYVVTFEFSRPKVCVCVYVLSLSHILTAFPTCMCQVQ